MSARSSRLQHDLGVEWLQSLTRAEVADYIYDLLSGAEHMAALKGMDDLSNRISVAANAAALQF